VAVAHAPDGIVLRTHRDLEGRRHEPWVRRVLLLLLLAIPVAALLNVFGQSPRTTNASARDARIQLLAPQSVRPGLLYEARFRVFARHELKKATLVLEPGWLEGFTLNTLEPSPVDEASDHGRLVFTLGHIPAGGSYRLYLQFQVNPTTIGRRSQDATLLDGTRTLARIHRTITVFP
jgi:hypothetical protein